MDIHPHFLGVRIRNAVLVFMGSSNVQIFDMQNQGTRRQQAFSNRLQDLRRQAKMSQEDLSFRSGVSQQTISKLENNPSGVRPKTVLALGKALQERGISKAEVEQLRIMAVKLGLETGLDNSYQGDHDPVSRKLGVEEPIPQYLSPEQFNRVIFNSISEDTSRSAEEKTLGELMAECVKLIFSIAEKDESALEILEMNIDFLKRKARDTERKSREF